jgi:hypothetical protein
MFYWTGVGSRDTPPDITKLMRSIAAGLTQVGGVLRSGGADGADSAFESGVPDPSKKEIYLPYAGFRGNRSNLFGAPSQASIEWAQKAHPYFDKMKPGSFSFNAHARNANQVLGQHCTSKAAFVVCWTPDGAERAEQAHSTNVTGGTRTAIVIAEMNGVPVFNLARPDALHRLQTYVKERVLLPQDAWAPDPIAMASILKAKAEKKARAGLGYSQNPTF